MDVVVCMLIWSYSTVHVYSQLVWMSCTKNTIVWKKVYFSLHDINADEAFGEDQTWPNSSQYCRLACCLRYICVVACKKPVSCFKAVIRSNTLTNKWKLDGKLNLLNIDTIFFVWNEFSTCLQCKNCRNLINCI